VLLIITNIFGLISYLGSHPKGLGTGQFGAARLQDSKLFRGYFARYTDPSGRYPVVAG
jgi:hypothetical protein